MPGTWLPAPTKPPKLNPSSLTTRLTLWCGQRSYGVQRLAEAKSRYIENENEETRAEFVRLLDIFAELVLRPKQDAAGESVALSVGHGSHL